MVRFNAEETPLGIKTALIRQAATARRLRRLPPKMTGPAITTHGRTKSADGRIARPTARNSAARQNDKKFRRCRPKLKHTRANMPNMMPLVSESAVGKYGSDKDRKS